jgi:integrase
MLLTGCRRGEALRARWSDLDLERGVWTKPSHHTKQKRTERLPLSGTALAFLHALQAESEGEVLFPGPTGAPLGDVKHFWQSVRRKAELEGVRLHDLRHSFASHLVSDGESLHVVGKLLGHTQAATTMRYAHVADDALRSASDKMGRVFADAQATARGEEVPDNVEPLHSKTRR